MTYSQDHELQLALGDAAARQLANATKTVPQLLTISPRWFVRLLHWLPVEAGIYRLNKVRDASRVEVACWQLVHLFQFPLNCHIFKKYRRVGSGFLKLDWELIILLGLKQISSPNKA